ncbi:hypothetical protein BB560_002700, partial [Smittium megazygosporum]
MGIPSCVNCAFILLVIGLKGISSDAVNLRTEGSTTNRPSDIKSAYPFSEEPDRQGIAEDFSEFAFEYKKASESSQVNEVYDKINLIGKDVAETSISTLDPISNVYFEPSNTSFDIQRDSYNSLEVSENNLAFKYGDTFMDDLQKNEDQFSKQITTDDNQGNDSITINQVFTKTNNGHTHEDDKLILKLNEYKYKNQRKSLEMHVDNTSNNSVWQSEENPTRTGANSDSLNLSKTAQTYAPLYNSYDVQQVGTINAPTSVNVGSENIHKDSLLVQAREITDNIIENHHEHHQKGAIYFGNQENIGDNHEHRIDESYDDEYYDDNQKYDYEYYGDSENYDDEYYDDNAYYLHHHDHSHEDEQIYANRQNYNLNPSKVDGSIQMDEYVVYCEPNNEDGHVDGHNYDQYHNHAHAH